MRWLWAIGDEIVSRDLRPHNGEPQTGVMLTNLA